MIEAMRQAVEQLATETAARAMSKRTTLATAESCSGGLIAHLLTSVAGISTVFAGGVVAYSNAAKHAFLGVPEELLSAYGAVSEPVAVAMARGARQRFMVDLAVSTTGIAGPAGGSETKPVGLVYVAISSAAGEQCRQFRFTGDRAENTIGAAREALNLLLLAVSTETD